MDLFIPYEYGYDFKVIVTNKTLKARRGAAYHEGRGSQEGIFAELKSHGHLNYIPVRRRPGNQTYLLAGLFAYNLMWELPMQTTSPQGIPPPSELRWGFLKKWIRFVRSSFGETVD